MSNFDNITAAVIRLKIFINNPSACVSTNKLKEDLETVLPLVQFKPAEPAHLDVLKGLEACYKELMNLKRPQPWRAAQILLEIERIRKQSQ